jgi:hypothetical protein
MRAKNTDETSRRTAPRAADPITRTRKVVEALVPAAHRPIGTGVHEAIVDAFVRPRPAKELRSTLRSPTKG